MSRLPSIASRPAPSPLSGPATPGARESDDPPHSPKASRSLQGQPQRSSTSCSSAGQTEDTQQGAKVSDKLAGYFSLDQQGSPSSVLSHAMRNLSSPEARVSGPSLALRLEKAPSRRIKSQLLLRIGESNLDPTQGNNSSNEAGRQAGPEPMPQCSPECHPPLAARTVNEPLCPPKTLLKILGAASADEPTSPTQEKPGRQPGVESSPPLPLKPMSPFVGALDCGWYASTALPSPDLTLDDTALAPSPLSARPSMRKRRSWKMLQSRDRSASIDTLHSLASLPVISSFKALTSSRNRESRAAKSGHDSEVCTFDAQPGEEAAATSGWDLEGTRDDLPWVTTDVVPGLRRQRRATDHEYLQALPSAQSTIRDRHGLPSHDSRKLFDRDDPALQDWNTFVCAYANGQLDLNIQPRMPSQGTPDSLDAPSCPDSWHQGPLLAPLPPWDAERQRSLNRLRLAEMPKERWARIQEICDDLQRRTQCRETIFVTIESDATHIWCTSTGFCPPGLYSRSHTICAHTILNRHDGLIFPDVHKDWRWLGNPLLGEVRYYAAMPVCSFDGMPLGTLCCIDSEPRSSLGDCEGDQTLLRELSEAIASELDGWAMECFRRKVDAINASWKALERHLCEKGDVRLGSRIAPPSDLLKSTRSPPRSPAIDLRDIASLGLNATYKDIANINFCASLIGEAVAFETVYVVAVPSPASRCVLIGSYGLSGPVGDLDPSVYVRALHSPEGGLVYEIPVRFRPSDAIEPSGNDGVGSQAASYQAAVFCPIYFNLPDLCRAGSSGSGLSTIIEAKPVHQSQDTLAHAATPKTAATRRCAILSTESCPSIGFVLVALTQSNSRVVGVEDLRYLQGFAEAIGALWKKCLPSATSLGAEATEEAAKIATAQAEELSQKRHHPSYLAAGKKAMKATGEGLTALMKGMHLSGSRVPADLATCEAGRRPRLRRQRTLSSIDSQQSTESESTAEAEADTHTSADHGGGHSRTASNTSSSTMDSLAFWSTAVVTALPMTAAETASLPVACPHAVPPPGCDRPSLMPFQPMGALPSDGLQPRPRKSRTRASVCAS